MIDRFDYDSFEGLIFDRTKPCKDCDGTEECGMFEEAAPGDIVEYIETHVDVLARIEHNAKTLALAESRLDAVTKRVTDLGYDDLEALIASHQKNIGRLEMLCGLVSEGEKDAALEGLSDLAYLAAMIAAQEDLQRIRSFDDYLSDKLGVSRRAGGDDVFKSTCRYDEDADVCPGSGCNNGCTCQVINQNLPFNQLVPKPDYPFNGRYTADEE